MATQDENNDQTIYELQLEKERENAIAALEFEQKKHRINNRWCDFMSWIFERYQNEDKKTILNLPEKTVEIFQDNGVRGASVYECFDIIIQRNEHIEDYLKKQRGKYSGSMPF